jgi:hypothetical protein
LEELDLEDLLLEQVPEVHKGHQVPQDLRVQRDELDVRVLLDLQEIQDLLVLLDLLQQVF